MNQRATVKGKNNLARIGSGPVVVNTDKKQFKQFVRQRKRIQEQEKKTSDLEARIEFLEEAIRRLTGDK